MGYSQSPNKENEMKKTVILFVLLFILLLPVSSQETEGYSSPQKGLAVITSIVPSNLHFAYFSLCAVGDAYVGLVYDAETANEFIGNAIESLEDEKKKVQLLRPLFSAPSDLKVIDLMLETYDDVLTQARELIKFIENPETSRFQESRNKAWKNISILLKL
jgi:hypothetical protein